MPPPRTFQNDRWTIGTPDLVVSNPVEVTVPAVGADWWPEWTVDPGYRWKPTDREWSEMPASKTLSLDYCLTMEEEDHQIVPTSGAEELVAYLMELRKAETPLPEAKE